MSRRHATPAFDPWTRLWIEAAGVAVDSAFVVTSRTLRLMSGGPLAAREAERMMSEKMAASMEFGAAVASDKVRSPRAAARRAIGIMGKRVRANRKRLA